MLREDIDDSQYLLNARYWLLHHNSPRVDIRVPAIAQAACIYYFLVCGTLVTV